MCKINLLLIIGGQLKFDFDTRKILWLIDTTDKLALFYHLFRVLLVSAVSNL